MRARMPLPRRQRGLAMLVLLALFAVAAAYLLVKSLNKTSVALTNARAESNRDVLQQAKAALIAWAASETLQPSSGQGFQPGALPCPDVNNDGTSDYSGSTACSSYLGRLPYATLGIADLRDASGERLWYAVSSNFIRSTSNVINSDTQGALALTGLAPASKLIAVVLAPGMRLGTQDRSAAGANTASNYLEDTNGFTNSTSFVSKTENVTDANVNNLFNDQVLGISSQDLFSVVDPIVAARVERDIVRQFIYDPSDPGDTSKFYGEWGRFPFAVPFANPGSSNFKGQAGTYEGLLPIISSLPYTWNTGSVVVMPTGGTGTVSADCSASSGTQLSCRITNTLSYWDAYFINAGWTSYVAPSFQMSGTINDVGTSFVFVKRPTTSDVSTSNPTKSLSNPVVSSSLDTSAVATATLNATLPFTYWGSSSSTCFGGTYGSKSITVKIAQPSIVSAIASTSSTDIPGWFNNNQWYKLTYYAVSPGYTPAPGLAGSCSPSGTPMCLTVTNPAPPNTNPTADAQAIVIFAGRSLSGASRPNGTLSDYLEGKNVSTGDDDFENGLGRTISGSTAAINDKVIIVAP